MKCVSSLVEFCCCCFASSVEGGVFRCLGPVLGGSVQSPAPLPHSLLPTSSLWTFPSSPNFRCRVWCLKSPLIIRTGDRGQTGSGSSHRSLLNSFTLRQSPPLPRIDHALGNLIWFRARTLTVVVLVAVPFVHYSLNGPRHGP